jgi:mannose-6-phosphate isomerase-like protein (cupin superfamily)
MEGAPRFRVTSLDDIERIPVDGGDRFSLQWLPVRSTLGIGAFGTNAYVADRAGDHVVEPHTETGNGHQELYFVARGRARFTIEGETLDAPAGTYVFLEDPGVHREAVAEEAGTTVLSFGAPEGEAYVVSPWEWSFKADALRKSDPERARAAYAEGLAQRPDNPGIHYNFACFEALEDNADAAIESLREAVRLKAETAEWAREDSDFASLRDDPRFASLIDP